MIKELNRLGMIIDLSHSSHKTALDAIQASDAPVIFSHSSAFALCNSTRNVHDDTLKLLVSDSDDVLINNYGSEHLGCLGFGVLGLFGLGTLAFVLLVDLPIVPCT